MKGTILHAKGKLPALDWERCWLSRSDWLWQKYQMLTTLRCTLFKMEWLQAKPGCQQSCRSCGPCAVLSGPRFSLAETCSNSCSCNSSSSCGLSPDVGFM